MLKTVVVSPGSFDAERFSQLGYHYHVEQFLRGIHSNGQLLMDRDNRIYDELCNAIERLGQVGNGKTTHALFEELLKKKRRKVNRFITTECQCERSASAQEVVGLVACRCSSDALILATDEHIGCRWAIPQEVPVLDLGDYIGSQFERERRQWLEDLAPIDQWPAGEFDQHIVRLTRYSRWLRFYDKQIGKGANLNRFANGIKKILVLWSQHCHYPRHELSVQLYTCLDKAPNHVRPEVVYARVRDNLARNLAESLGIRIELHFNCTFPENTEPAATGQGVVSADFSTPTGERPSRARRGSPR